MDSCIFGKIVRGELPAAKVWEDDKFLAFLSISPINPGHTLVIPKEHVPYIFNLDDDLLGELFAACKPIAKALAKVFKPATGYVGVMVAGLGVPHAHVHLIPMNSEGDLTFERQKQGVPLEELEVNAKKIREALSGR